MRRQREVAMGFADAGGLCYLGHCRFSGVSGMRLTATHSPKAVVVLVVWPIKGCLTRLSSPGTGKKNSVKALYVPVAQLDRQKKNQKTHKSPCFIGSNWVFWGLKNIPKYPKIDQNIPSLVPSLVPAFAASPLAALSRLGSLAALPLIDYQERMSRKPKHNAYRNGRVHICRPMSHLHFPQGQPDEP